MFKKTEASLKHPIWGTWLVTEVNHKQLPGIKLLRNRFCTDTEEAGTWETAPKQVQAVGTAFLEMTCQKAILTVSTHIIYVLNLMFSHSLHPQVSTCMMPRPGLMPAIQVLHPELHKELQCNNGRYPLFLHSPAKLLLSSLASKDVIMHKLYFEAGSDFTGCKAERE